MSFLAPFFLIGLGALLVPIIIHMWSKDAKQSVAFGSLRFLKETETRTTRSIMPSQWLLLLTRLLLLTLLVFLLAEMQLPSEPAKISRLYVVDPVYADSELLTNLLDTVSEESEVRWLVNNFPLIDQPLAVSSANYWDLLSKLPTTAECVVVISPLYQKAFNGKRVDIPSICQWIKPPVEPIESEIVRVNKNGVSKALKAKYDEWSTTFALEDSDEGEPIEVTYHLKVDETYEKIGEVFTAALSSVQNVSMITLNKVETLEGADWIIWLSDQPNLVDRPIILQDQDVLGWSEITDDFILVYADLTKEEAVQMELPRKLLDVFVGNRFDIETGDLLTVDTKIFQYREGNIAKIEILKDASSYLWIALMIIFLFERWLSYKSSVVEK